jgi:hypothetical protein
MPGSLIKQKKKISKWHSLPVSFCVVVRDPPPVCLDVPYAEKLFDFCIRFYEIDVSTTHLHACVRLEAHMVKILELHKFEIGCIDIGPPGSSSGTERITLIAVFVGFFSFKSSCNWFHTFVDLGGVGTLKRLGKMLKYIGEFIFRLFHIYIYIYICVCVCILYIYIYKGYNYMFWPSSWSTCYT